MCHDIVRVGLSTLTTSECQSLPWALVSITEYLKAFKTAAVATGCKMASAKHILNINFPVEYL